MKHGYLITNVILAVIFILLSAVIFLRKTDGAGLAQSPHLRFVTFVVLVIFFALIVVGELIVFAVSHRRRV